MLLPSIQGFWSGRTEVCKDRSCCWEERGAQGVGKWGWIHLVSLVQDPFPSCFCLHSMVLMLKTLIPK